jgi:molecular chaperone GrpE
MSKKDNLAKPTGETAASAPARTAGGVPGTAPPATDPTEAADPPTEAAADASFSPQQIEELNAKAARADEHWERLLRTTADLENFKKRAARERQDAIKFANESLLARLIPALDNFDMALAAANTAEGNSMESLRTGITMVYNQLKVALTEAGLEEIDATNQPFDPKLHEAVSQQESAEVPEGHVLQQLRKGYKLRDRLLRPASVVVAKKPAT